MEIIRINNSRNKKIVLNLYKNNSKKIIIMSHGFTGDKSEHGLFDEAIKNFSKNNFDILVFDFSGSGESDDDELTIEKEVDDLLCVIKFIEKNKYEKINLLGYSLGGLVSLRVIKILKDKINSLVLWAPVTDKKENYAEYKFSENERKELEEKGIITIYKNSKWRKKIIVDKQMIFEREIINQDELLKDIEIPVLIIHGEKDKNVPLNDSINAIKKLNEKAKLEILKDEDHFFRIKKNELFDLSINWFKKYN